MRLETKNKRWDASCKLYPVIGIAAGVEMLKYSSKVRRTYTIIILCFVWDITVVRTHKLSNLKTDSTVTER